MQGFHRLVSKIADALFALSLVAGVLMMLHVTIDVLSRTLFNSPLPGTGEITATYYMIAVAFLPLAWVTLRDEHVTADIFVSALPGLAHAAEPDRPDDYIGDLAKCQSLTDDPARLACYDEKVAAMVAARDAGTVRLVDREVVRRTRRELFGFALPNIGLLKDSDGASDAMETLQTTITSVRYQKSGDIRFTTAEGALWEIIKPPKRLTQVKAGDSVEFRKASMGTYFIRIGNQMGVRGKRLE